MGQDRASEFFGDSTGPSDEDDRALRRMLWMRHGCGFNALYRDDGEMSCGKCLIDFKRMNPALIEKLLQRRDEREISADLTRIAQSAISPGFLTADQAKRGA